MKTFHHFVITRFNLKVDAWETTRDNEKVRTEEWLRHRYQLFQNYCLPSMMHQSNKDFVWLVFFDVDTSEQYRQLNHSIEGNLVNFKPLYIDGLKSLNTELKKYIEKYLNHNPSKHIITTRLDNDDIVHEDFIKAIQSRFEEQNNLVIDLRSGYQLTEKQNYYELREYEHAFNAFISLVEKSETFETVLSRMHYDWRDSEYISAINDQRLWIEFVHGKNKENATRKYMLKTDVIDLGSFALSSVDIQLETKYKIIVDNIITVMASYFVNIFRALVKIIKRYPSIEKRAKQLRGFFIKNDE